MFKRVLIGGGLVLLVLMAVVLARTFVASSGEEGAPPALPAAAIDEPAALERFAAALRQPTVSTAEAPPSSAELAELHARLAVDFPLVHARLQVEEIGDAGALLYTWAGRDRALPPIILMAHQDTVPVDEDSRNRWRHAPFSGEIAEGTIWGRGALDDKASLVAQLEAVELLLQSGFVPARTVYLAFGNDEERGGTLGAGRIAAELKQRGVRAEFVLDEGGAIASGMMPGVSGPVALVGIAEKGYQSVRLAVEVAGGHSSQPPSESAIALLSAALVRLQETPMPARINPVAAATFDALAPQLPFTQRLVMRNRWLTGPLLLRMLQNSPAGAAMVRTTTALTMFDAGIKDNVLPTSASAVINFRIAPGDTRDSVLAHVRGTVADRRITVEAFGDVGKNPSPVSAVDNAAFATITRNIRRVAPDVPVVPYLMLAASDAPHFAEVSDAQYRFVPFTLDPATAPRIHGIDEGVAVTDYLRCIRFYHALIQDAAG